jgi:predicted metal-dependent peptidase
MALGGECFFGSLALRFPWVEDNTCPTMATDGQRFYFNSQFVESITENEVKAVIIHEIMHVALMHPLRVKGHDHRRANIAMDYAINLLIRDAGYRLPSMALLDDRYKDMSWEQIYKLLPEQKKDKSKDGQGQGQGQPDFSNGDVLPCPGTAEELSAAQEHIKVSVAQAEQAARAVGKLPGWLQDLLALAREPEEDYTYLFEKFMAPMFPKDYTWQRPSRRFIGQGMYLPSMMKDGVGTLVVGLDTSASVSNQELSGFLGLINHFLERVKPEMTHVLYCDTTMYKHERFKPGRPMELEGFQAQRGGTRFSPVFEYAIENDLKPKAYVYLTDMECDDFGPDPGVPVLWMQVGSSAYAARPPFGQVIRIKNV